MDWALLTRRLAATARESMGSLASFLGPMEENAKLSRVLREPTRRIVTAFQRQTKATAVMDEWDRRLQALGVPVPPEDWEPESEDEAADGAGRVQQDMGAEEKPDAPS
jgi:hypothetical protein